jgi:AcrR family transcriptional regulator
MAKRAEQVAQTRERIVEATVHLHEALGPAATTIAAIAEEADVTRLTVYRHFPDEDSLFAACTQHWLSQQALPDPEAWMRIADPVERLQVGLTDIYRYYHHAEGMLTMVHRDKDALPHRNRRMLEEQGRLYRDTLLKAFAARGVRRRKLRALIGHTVSFETWRSLCVEHGLSNREAVAAMASLITTIPAPAPSR